VRTAADTIEKSQTSTAKGRPTREWMPATVEKQTTEGKPTATEMPETVWTPTTHDFLGEICEKTCQNGEKFVQKRHKKSKSRPFSVG